MPILSLFVAAIFFISLFVGFPAAVIGLVIGFVGMKSGRRRVAISGYVVGSIGLVAFAFALLEILLARAR